MLSTAMVISFGILLSWSLLMDRFSIELDPWPQDLAWCNLNVLFYVRCAHGIRWQFVLTSVAIDLPELLLFVCPHISRLGIGRHGSRWSIPSSAFWSSSASLVTLSWELPFLLRCLIPGIMLIHHHHLFLSLSKLSLNCVQTLICHLSLVLIWMLVDVLILA